MNKRQRKKHLKRILERMSTFEAWEKISAHVGDFIKQQLLKPSLAPAIIQTFIIAPAIIQTFIITPKLDPPYRLWADEGNVVHWTGVNVREKFDDRGPFQDKSTLRLCDFQEVDDGRMVMPDEAVTCLRCATYQHERMA